MLDLLAFAASTRQIHRGLGASGANPKARVQAVDSVRRAPYARLLDLGPTTRPRCPHGRRSTAPTTLLVVVEAMLLRTGETDQIVVVVMECLSDQNNASASFLRASDRDHVHHPPPRSGHERRAAPEREPEGYEQHRASDADRGEDEKDNGGNAK